MEKYDFRQIGLSEQGLKFFDWNYQKGVGLVVQNQIAKCFNDLFEIYQDRFSNINQAINGCMTTLDQAVSDFKKFKKLDLVDLYEKIFHQSQMIKIAWAKLHLAKLTNQQAVINNYPLDLLANDPNLNISSLQSALYDQQQINAWLNQWKVLLEPENQQVNKHQL